MAEPNKLILNSVEKSGSVRVDLLGGTLDLFPINHLYKSLFTLNMATSLKAKVKLKKIDQDKIIIHSTNYQSSNEYPLELSFYKENIFQPNSYEELTFVLLLIDHFKLEEGIEVWLDSDAPAGSGLGGSSSLGVTLFSALSEMTGQKNSKELVVKAVRNYEGMILNQGIPGYQDYYPALFGGILALKADVMGTSLEQIYDEELKSFLEEKLHLLYSGSSRDSGINNWNVYKGFFDNDEKIRVGMSEIAHLSREAYQAIKSKNYMKLLELIVLEGKARKKLSSTILNEDMKKLETKLSELNRAEVGLKVCGAGGGGCFLVTGLDEAELDSYLEQTPFKKLPLKVEGPLA